MSETKSDKFDRQTTPGTRRRQLCVTGAGGFLGRYVVADALRRGYRVRALVRRNADISAIPWRNAERVQVCFVDLRSRDTLGDALLGCDSVVHLASRKTGDLHAQL